MRPCRNCGGTDRHKSGHCRVCHNANNAKSRQRHPDRVKARNDRYYKANTQKLKDANGRYAKENPEKVNAHGRKQKRKRNGWLPGEHERAEAERPFVTSCACCGSTEPCARQGWHADHSHTTFKYRAHVCKRCNDIVGWIEDGYYPAADHPRQAAYLARYPEWASVSAM